MALLTRDVVFSAQDIKREEVEIPEWGGSVLVRGMNGLELEKLFKSTKAEVKSDGSAKVDGGEGFKQNLKLVITCTIDENGNQLFSEADVDALSKKAVGPIQKIALKAMELSGFGGNTEKN